MRNHLYVAEFRGGAKGTTVYIPVLHEGGTNAGSQGEKHPIVVALGPAEFVFTPGRGISVVFEAHRNPQRSLQFSTGVAVTPWQVWGESNDFTVGVQEAGNGQPHSADTVVSTELIDNADNALLQLVGVVGRLGGGGINNISGFGDCPSPHVGSADIKTNCDWSRHKTHLVINKIEESRADYTDQCLKLPIRHHIPYRVSY